jgi:peptidoglycan/LPS O-acetylase OafA/YrhL
MLRGVIGEQAISSQTTIVAGQARQATRFGGLDGLRAIAALSIVVHHVGFDSGSTFRQPMMPFLGRADVGVPIFFVLSGFLLYRPFVARLLDGGTAPASREFLAKRFVRVFPAYWVALTLMLILGGIAVRGPVGYFFSFTLLHVYHPSRGISGITQSWSLATEIGFYLILPFWHRMTVRLSKRRSDDHRAVVALLAIGLLYVSSLLFRTLVGLTRPSFAKITPQWFVAQCDIFALGMVLAVGHAWSQRNPRVAEFTHGLSQRVGLWYLGALGAFWFAATQLELSVGLETSTVSHEMIRQFFYGIIGVALVLPMAWGGGLPSRIGRLLNSALMTFLGTISYGIYLWHQFVFIKIRKLFGWPVFDGHFWPLLAGAVFGSTAIAALSHRFIEQPLSRLVSRRLRAVDVPGV